MFLCRFHILCRVIFRDCKSSDGFCWFGGGINVWQICMFIYWGAKCNHVWNIRLNHLFVEGEPVTNERTSLLSWKAEYLINVSLKRSSIKLYIRIVYRRRGLVFKPTTLKDFWILWETTDNFLYTRGCYHFHPSFILISQRLADNFSVFANFSNP